MAAGLAGLGGRLIFAKHREEASCSRHAAKAIPSRSCPETHAGCWHLSSASACITAGSRLRSGTIRFSSPVAHGFGSRVSPNSMQLVWSRSRGCPSATSAGCPRIGARSRRLRLHRQLQLSLGREVGCRSRSRRHLVEVGARYRPRHRRWPVGPYRHPPSAKPRSGSGALCR